MHCRCSAQMPPPPLPAAKLPSTPWSSSIQTPDPLFKRRDFTSCALLLALINPPQLRAEASPSPPPPECLQSESPTKKAFIDVSIDGEPIGRILIGLYTESAPRGAARFSNLVSGKSGVTYRRKEFVKIMPNYIQHGGLRSFGVDAEVAGKTGTNLTTADALLEEWIKQKENNNCAAANNLAKSVSIIVRDPMKSPPKLKLIARKGRLEIDEEAVGVDPNGTEFAIALRDSPELDEAALVVGKVVGGMDVVERIANVRTVQENSSSPYFRVAKLIGDKRAVVAERGFNRPYSKVVITNCGLIDS